MEHCEENRFLKGEKGLLMVFNSHKEAKSLIEDYEDLLLEKEKAGKTNSGNPFFDSIGFKFTNIFNPSKALIYSLKNGKVAIYIEGLDVGALNSEMNVLKKALYSHISKCKKPYSSIAFYTHSIFFNQFEIRKWDVNSNNAVSYLDAIRLSELKKQLSQVVSVKNLFYYFPDAKEIQERERNSRAHRDIEKRSRCISKNTPLAEVEIISNDKNDKPIVKVNGDLDFSEELFDNDEYQIACVNGCLSFNCYSLGFRIRKMLPRKEEDAIDRELVLKIKDLLSNVSIESVDSLHDEANVALDLIEMEKRNMAEESDSESFLRI